MTYLRPIPGNPTRLTLVQFLQTVFVGVTGLDGTLVRPKWQVEPPKQPDIFTDWMAFGISRGKPDANAYTDINDDGITDYQRQEKLEIGCTIYGPNAVDTYGLIQDGFQIQANRRALFLSKMGFVEVTDDLHIPDLVNERWVDRVETLVVINRTIQRTYNAVTFVSASGILYADPGENIVTGTWGVS